MSKAVSMCNGAEQSPQKKNQSCFTSTVWEDKVDAICLCSQVVLW